MQLFPVPLDPRQRVHFDQPKIDEDPMDLTAELDKALESSLHSDV